MTGFRYSDWRASWDDIAVGMRFEVSAEVVTSAVVTEVQADAVVLEYEAHGDLVVRTVPRDSERAQQMLDWLTSACDWWTGSQGLPPAECPGVRASQTLVERLAQRHAPGAARIVARVG